MDSSIDSSIISLTSFLLNLIHCDMLGITLMVISSINLERLIADSSGNNSYNVKSNSFAIFIISFKIFFKLSVPLSEFIKVHPLANKAEDICFFSTGEK